MVGVKRYLGILLLVTFEPMQGCLLRVDSKGGFVIKITHELSIYAKYGSWSPLKHDLVSKGLVTYVLAFNDQPFLT